MKRCQKHIIAAVTVLFAVIIALLLTFYKSPGTDEPPPPSPTPLVTVSVTSGSIPEPSARPIYPDNIFGTSSSINETPPDEWDEARIEYPGADDVPLPPNEVPSATPAPIYQDEESDPT